MKKKLTLILSIVLVLAVAVCAVLLATATSESSTHFAQTEAIRLWKAAEENWATKLQTASNGGTEYTYTEGNVSLLGITNKDGTATTATFTFKNGILTLKGNGETVHIPKLASNGALWLVLDNISVNSWIQNDSNWKGQTDYPAQAPSVDIPLIISSPIDTSTYMVKDGDEYVGGMVGNDAAASWSLVNGGSLVLLGDVGFEYNGYGGETIAVRGRNCSKSLILAPGRASSVYSTNGSSYRSIYNNANQADDLMVLSGSIFDDTIVPITVNENIRMVNGSIRLIDNASVTVAGKTATSDYGDGQVEIYGGTGKVEITDGSKLVVKTTMAIPVYHNGNKKAATVTADATSAVYYETLADSVYTYAFPVAGNYKVGDSVFTVVAGSKLNSATELSFTRTSDAATVGTITHTDASGVKTALVDLPGNGATSILNGAVSYDTDTKSVTLNNATGNSLHFNISDDFTLNITGDNALGTTDVTEVIKVAGGDITVTGTGKLTLTAKRYAFTRYDAGTYTQTGATVICTGTSTEHRTFHMETGLLTLTGGTLDITSGGMYAASLCGGFVVDGADATLNVTGVNNALYFKVKGELKNGTINANGGENTLYNAVTLTVSGGTLNAIAKNNRYAIRGGTVIIEGGTVNAYSGIGYAMQGTTLQVKGGTLNTTAMVDGVLKESNTGASYTTVTVEGGTVNAVGTSAANAGVINATTYSQIGGTVTATALDGSNGNALRATNITVGQNAVLNAYALDTDSTTNHAIFAVTNMTVNGGEVVAISKNQRAISSDSGSFTLNGGKVSTYGTVNGADMTTKFGIYVKDLKVTNGTADIKGLQNSAFVGTNSILIEGGAVTVESARGSLHSGKSIKITGGTVVATALNSANAITTNNGATVEISGGTLTATAPQTAMKIQGNMTVSGGTVKIVPATALAKDVPALSVTGNLTLSGGTLEANGDVAFDVNIISAANVTLSNGTLKGNVNGAGTLVSATDKIDITGGTLEVTGTANGALRANEIAISQTAEMNVSGASNLIWATTLNISGGTVNVTATGDHGLRATDINISGGNVTVDAASWGIRAQGGTYTQTGGAVDVSVDAIGAVTGSVVNVQGGTLNVEGGNEAPLFRVCDGTELNLTGGKITGVTGYFISYNNNADNKINITDGVYIDVCYTSNELKLIETNGVLTENVPNNIWLDGSSWTDRDYWLTTKNWVDNDEATSTPRVLLTLKDNVIYEMSLVGASRFYHNETNPVLTLTATGALINLAGESIPEGEIFKIKANGNLSLNLTDGSVMNLGSASNTKVLEVLGSLTVCGKGTLKINASSTAIVVGGSYEQTEAAVEINTAGGNGIKATENINILGGSLKITGKANGALTAGANTTISSQSGASTYVDITAYANVINGNNVTLTISGEEYDAAANTGTYVKIVASNDYGIRVKNVNITGGTINLDVAKTRSIDATGDLTISGGNLTVKQVSGVGLQASNNVTISGADTSVNIYSAGRAINAKYVTISGGTVKTYVVEGGTELRSTYGITSTTGGLKITGGTVDAKVTENSAICAYNSGNVEISGDANVTVWAKSSGIVSRLGDVKISGGTIDVTVSGVYGIVAGSGAADTSNNVEISGGNVTVSGKPGADKGAVHATGSYTQTAGTVTATAIDGSEGNALRATDMIIKQNAVLTASALDADSTVNYAIYGVNSVSISGGTVTADSTNAIAIHSAKTIEISGGVVKTTSYGVGLNALTSITMKDSAKVYLYSINGRAVNAPNVEIAGGEVSTYLVDDAGNPTKYSKYGITSTTGTLKITGGTVNAEVTANSALCAYTRGNIEISGGTVTAKAPTKAIVVTKGDLKVSDTANVTAEAKTGIYGVSVVTGNVIVSGGTLTASTPKSGRALQVDTGNLTVSGGTLTATATSDTAIQCDNVTVSGGTVKATAGKRNAIYAKTSMTVSGGTVEAIGVPAAASQGTLVTATYTQTGGDVTVNGGASMVGSSFVATNVTVSGGTMKATAEKANCAALSVAETLTVSGGTVEAHGKEAYGYNVIKAKNVVLSDGTLKGSTKGGTFIYATETLDVSGGTLDVTGTGNVVVKANKINISQASGKTTTVNVSGSANIIGSSGADRILTISGGNVTVTATGDNGLRIPNINISGGNVTVDAASWGIHAEGGTYTQTGGNVSVAVDTEAAVIGKSINVQGGALDVRGGEAASLFRVYGGSELNLTGGKVSGLLGYFIKYDKNDANKINIQNGVYIDVCYLNDTFRNAGSTALLSEQVPTDIWLKDCGWTDSNHWLTTSNWTDGTVPTPRVILTLKDNKLFELSMNNRFYPSVSDPIFTLTVDGTIVNLDGKSVAEGEILRVDAYENLTFDIPDGVVINLGSAATSNVVKTLKSLTLTGTGTLKINAKSNAIVVGGSYKQTETAVEINTAGGNGIKATEDIDILGGSLKMTGKANGALSAGKSTNISNLPGASTYVDITAYANVINGNNTTFTVSGEEYDAAADTGTYVKIVSTADYGIRVKDVNISGGTIVMDIAKGNAINAGESITVSGGTVYSRAATGRAINAKYVTISGGTVSTYILDASNNPVYSAYGITSTTGGLTISGGTVNAEVTANSALCAYTSGNIEISGGTVTAKAATKPLVVSDGNLIVSGGDATVEAITGAYGVNVTGNVTVSGGTLTATTTNSGRAIQINNGDLTVTGGTVNATAKNDLAVECQNATVSGGELNATAGNTAISIKENMTVSGGELKINATTHGISVGASYTQTEGVVEIDAAGGNGIKAADNIDIQGGKVVITGKTNGALSAGKSTNISNKPGASTYVDITAYANVINGNNTTFTVSGEEYDAAADTGTYVKIVSTKDYGVRVKNVNISGGTLALDIATQAAINASESITVSGGAVYSRAADGRAINATSVTISGGTVNTYILDEFNNPVYSKWGITATTGGLIISGGTVNAEVTANSALCAYTSGNIEISGGTVTAKAATKPLVVSDGNLIVSGGDATVEAITGAYGVNVTGNVTVSGGSLAASTLNSGRALQINNGDLTVTGGTVKAAAKNDIAIEAKNISISGGTIEASANTWNGILAKESVAITGGTVKLTGEVNGGLVAPEISISGEDTVVDLTGKANVLSGGSGNLTITDGNVTVTATADNAIRVANIKISGGNVNANAGSTGINASANLEISGGTITAITSGGNGLRGGVVTVTDGTIRTYNEDGDRSAGGIYGTTSLEISGGTVDIDITGNHGIGGGTVKLYQKNKNVPTNISTTAGVYAIYASKNLEIDGLSIDAVATTGRAIQSDGTMTITDSKINASATKDIAIQGVDVVVKESTVNAQANSGSAVYAKNSLEISGGEFTVVMNNTNAIRVEGDLTIKDQAIIDATANNCRSTAGAIIAYNFYLLGEKGDKGPQVSVTMNSAEFKKGELRQIRGVQFGDPTHTPGEVVLEGGNLNVTINNNYSDTEYEYNNKKNDVSTNRTVGLMLRNLASIDFVGTNVTVDLNTQLDNYKTSGFMQISGSIPTQVTISDGALKCDGNGDVQAMFYSEINETTFDIVGGEITGAAKYFWFSEKLNQVLTVKPGASIDFYNYKNSVSIGRTNAYNGTTPSWFEDEGVEYLFGCSLKDNSHYLTTGTEGIASQIEILVQEGDTTKTYVLNADYPAYPADASPEAAKAYYVGNGEVVLKNLTANQIRSNGRVTLTLKGINTVSGEGTHRIRSMGDIVIGGDGVLNVTGTNYVIYSYRGSEIVIKDQAQLNLTATTGSGIHMNHTEKLTTAVTITDDAKVNITAKGQPIYIRGIETSVNINGNASVELTSENNYGIGAYGNAQEDVPHKATVNIGEDAKVVFNGKSGILVNGQVATINVNGNAVVDMSCPKGYPFNGTGANPNVNIGGNAKVNVAEGNNDVFNLNSNLAAMEGVKQEASVYISGNASLVNKHALHCAARINVSAKDAEGKAVAGKSIFHVSDQAFADLNSDGQTIYLVAQAAGSVAALKVTDQANLNVTNLCDSDYSAILIKGMESNVEFTTKGTVNVNAAVPAGSGAVLIQHPSGGKNVVRIKDATVNITNIQSTERESLNASGENTYKGDRSIALYLQNESDVVISGNAKVNLRAERNGKKYANTAFGLYMTGVEGATKLTIKDRAQLNATSGGNSNMNLGSGIFIQNCDILVTDNATLRGSAVGTSSTGINLNRNCNITVEKYGMAYFTGESNKSFGINGYNGTTKAVFTVTDGGRIFASAGMVAINLKTGQISFVASGMEAGKTEEELKEEKLDLLSRNYSKYGYVVLKGELDNPRTSDALLPTVITVTVLVAAAAVAVTVLRKKKAKEN